MLLSVNILIVKSILILSALQPITIFRSQVAETKSLQHRSSQGLSLKKKKKQKTKLLVMPPCSIFAYLLDRSIFSRALENCHAGLYGAIGTAFKSYISVKFHGKKNN